MTDFNPVPMLGQCADAEDSRCFGYPFGGLPTEDPAPGHIFWKGETIHLHPQDDEGNEWHV